MKQKTFQCESEKELYTAIKELFHAGAACMHKNHYGPKIFTDLQRVALLILRVRSGLSYERFCNEYLPESKWPRWLGLRELPSDTSVWRWTRKFDMKFIRQLNKQLLACEQPTIMAIDGTGIDSWRRSRHYETRIGERGRDFSKADIVSDSNTQLIHDWSLLLKPRHDAHVAKQLLSRTPHRGVLVLGDKGYDSEELYTLCAERNNRLWTPLRNAPRSNAPPKRLGQHKRASHKQGCDQPGKRSLVESTIRSLKSRISALTARLHYMKKREFAWHILARNIQLQIALLLRVLRTLATLHNPV